VIGRVYLWRDAYWRVLVRWHGAGPRNVLLERVAPWSGVGWGDHWFRDSAGRWWRPDGGELVVRPFRGLRRVA
jgi:hypothetical protein